MLIYYCFEITDISEMHQMAKNTLHFNVKKIHQINFQRAFFIQFFYMRRDFFFIVVIVHSLLCCILQERGLEFSYLKLKVQLPKIVI